MSGPKLGSDACFSYMPRGSPFLTPDEDCQLFRTSAPVHLTAVSSALAGQLFYLSLVLWQSYFEWCSLSSSTFWAPFASSPLWLVWSSLLPPFLFLTLSQASPELSCLYSSSQPGSLWMARTVWEWMLWAVTDSHLLSVKALSLHCSKDTEHTNTVLHSRPRLGQEEKTTFFRPFFFNVVFFSSSLPSSLNEAC